MAKANLLHIAKESPLPIQCPVQNTLPVPLRNISDVPEEASSQGSSWAPPLLEAILTKSRKICNNVFTGL